MFVSRPLLLFWTVICHFLVSCLADTNRPVPSNTNADILTNPVPIIKIESDGTTCPKGFQSTPRQNVPGIGLTCVQPERSLVGNIPVREYKATCCTKEYQNVFLVSIEGRNTPRPGAQYTLDAKTCCPSDQVPAETGVQQCRYEGNSLKVQDGQLTQCCWVPSVQDFNAHLEDYSAGLAVPLNNETTLGLDNPICDSVYLRAGTATLRASSVQIEVFVELRCGPFGNKADNQTLTINFNHNRMKAGTLTFDFSVGNVVADISSQMAETTPGSGHYDIKLHGDVFGTAVIGSVHVPFDYTIDPNNTALDWFINANGVC